jgi:hypothetical protein
VCVCVFKSRRDSRQRSGSSSASGQSCWWLQTQRSGMQRPLRQRNWPGRHAGGPAIDEFVTAGRLANGLNVLGNRKVTGRDRMVVGSENWWPWLNKVVALLYCKFNWYQHLFLKIVLFKEIKWFTTNRWCLYFSPFHPAALQRDRAAKKYLINHSWL